MQQNQARSRLKVKKPPFFKKYLSYSYCLFIALFAYFLLYLLISKIYPSQIQNFLFKNSYLPFFALLFIANFLLFTFLFLNKKIGLTISFFMHLLIYFRLNQLRFDFASVLFIIITGTIFASLIFFDEIKKNYKK
jgi:hypothetical protein